LARIKVRARRRPWGIDPWTENGQKRFWWDKLKRRLHCDFDKALRTNGLIVRLE